MHNLVDLRRLGIALAAALAIGCTSITPAATSPSTEHGSTQPPPVTPIIIYVTPAPATPAPGSTTAPLRTAQPTPAPSLPGTEPPPVTPAPATPASTSGAEQDQAVLRTWTESGYVTAQVITPVTNTGTTWIELLQFDTNWTIYDATGGITATGSYASEVGPRYLAPGETGYVVADNFDNSDPKSAYATAEMDVYFNETTPQERLTVDDVKVKSDDIGGLEVLGQVTNPGSERVDSADVLAVFLDDSGSPLGFADGLAQNIEPGSPRAFTASASFVGISLSDVAQTLVYASSSF